MNEASSDGPSEPGGTRLGRYLLRYMVAEGGMASVYLAQLPGPHGFEKWVAVKVMHRHLARNRRFVTMFLDEARVAARIHHPNVCSVLDFGEGEGEGAPYLVMEYLHGESFSSILRRGKKFPPPRWLAARIVTDAARGLHAAHELKSDDDESLGVVHRDVSPQNIAVLYDGVAKVFDFGIARLRGRVGDTKSGELKGKIRYMAPEQLRREPIDRRADIWALGVVLWESTVGRRLFRSESEGAVVLDIIKRDIPKPSDQVEGYPPELEAVVMRALSRDVETRYPTAAALADDLEKYLYAAGEPAGPAQVGEFMAGAFADRRSARDALLRAPPLPVDTIPEVDLGELGPDVESSFSAAAEALEPPAPSGRLDWRILAAGAVLLLIALAVGLAIGAFGGSGEGDGSGTTMAGTSPPPPPPPPVVDAAVSGAPAGGDGAVEAAPEEPSSDAGPEEASSDGGADGAGSTLAWDAAPDEGPRPHRPHKRPEAGPPGHLNLLAIPPAEVFRRGRRLGRTPLFNVSLPPGRHRLTLRPLGGGRSKTITVRITSGQTVRRSVRLGS